MSVIDNIRLTFLYIEFYSMGKTWVYPESYIPYNIFRYIVKGKAEFCIDGEEIIVKENQIVYIPQGCRMSCRALSESFEFYSLRFTTSVFYEGEDVLKEYYGIPRIIENEGEDYYFKEICKWVKKDSWVKKCFVRGYLDLLIGTLSMRVNKFDKNTGKVTEKNENPVLKIAKRKEQIDSRVQLVADYVVLHPREKYTPQKMAEMVELSKQRFSSLFKANMGKSPMEYVREIRLGVDAIAAIPPIYFHLPEYAIAQYWNDISAAAPNTDFVIYNIPQLAGVALTQGLFAEMRKNPNVIGVKNSSMPVQDIQMFKQAAGPDYIIFNGPDEQFMSGRVIGAEGAIGGTYGVMPELYLKLDEYVRAGKMEEAREIQYACDEIIYKMCSAHGNMYAVIKAILKINEGLELGGVKEPLPGLIDEDSDIVKKAAQMICDAKKKYL